MPAFHPTAIYLAWILFGILGSSMDVVTTLLYYRSPLPLLYYSMPPLLFNVLPLLPDTAYGCRIEGQPGVPYDYLLTRMTHLAACPFNWHLIDSPPPIATPYIAPLPCWRRFPCLVGAPMDPCRCASTPIGDIVWWFGDYARAWFLVDQ